MITETISFKNFNGEDDSRVMHFHISEAVLMENFSMRDRIARLAQILEGESRQLVMAEIQEIVDMVKWFMSISYGVKSVDGTEFDQDDPVGSGEIWRKFKNSPAYSAFLLSLFQEPEKCVNFIVRVLPAELRQEAEKEASPEMKRIISEAQGSDRPPPGSKIDESGVVTTPAEQRALRVAPEPSTDDDIDFDAILKEAKAVEDSNKDKKAISQKDHDLMRASLRNRPGQFEKFMETRFVDPSL
jgi:hypothetical protein